MFDQISWQPKFTNIIGYLAAPRCPIGRCEPSQCEEHDQTARYQMVGRARCRPIAGAYLVVLERIESVGEAIGGVFAERRQVVERPLLHTRRRVVERCSRQRRASDRPHKLAVLLVLTGLRHGPLKASI